MNICKRHRFPPQIIRYAVWPHHRFNPSHGDIEDLPAERGTFVGREPNRLWSIKFGPKLARRLRRKHPGFGDTLYVDSGTSQPSPASETARLCVLEGGNGWVTGNGVAAGRPGQADLPIPDGRA